ncbi:uncharacterized protein G2W53_032130 [Senna tora]|uniref:Uncharacterized protein n=1 Tax=Senna tora TaxID=362788 RepID=A0A834T772_9FABA|nr:uncharacterized protein G2W53_032130 [Senna tora]
MGLARKNKPYGYSKMEKEDPEDIIHRRAQFLIYKAMEQADSISSSSTSKPSSYCLMMRIRICKLKVKIGRRLRRFRKKLLSTAKSAFQGHLLMAHFKFVRRFFVPIAARQPINTGIEEDLKTLYCSGAHALYMFLDKL